MIIKIGKKESTKRIAGKLNKIKARSKKVNWDKYFGKIDFPIDALTYQRKMRDEWTKSLFTADKGFNKIPGLSMVLY